MTCAEVQELIEAVASGDVPAGPEFTAHLSGCPACTASLAQARYIEQALAGLPPPAVPPGFSQAVMAALRQQRWRYEEHIDRAFNVTMGIGIVLVVVAIVSLLNVGSVAQLLLAGVQTLSEIPQQRATWPGTGSLPTAAVVAALAATALAVWWWAERRSDFDHG